MPAPASSLSDVLRLATTDADAAATKGIAGDLARAEQAIAAEDAISEALRVRHLAGLPYTWLAEDSVLLSCNPQRPLGAMHGRAQIARHASLPAGPAAAEPHIYALAEAAVRKVLGGESACGCVLGESGAGKSEASKLALLHVLHRGGELRGVGGGGPDEPLRRAPAAEPAALCTEPAAPCTQPAAPLAGALLLSRPVVEALTHASTRASGNATRIGLATRLWFMPAGHEPATAAAAAAAPTELAGARLHAFGLCSRLAAMGGHAAPGACSFHVLHALARSATPKQVGLRYA